MKIRVLFDEDAPGNKWLDRASIVVLLLAALYFGGHIVWAALR